MTQKETSDKPMSLGDHLDDLRVCLTRCLILFIATLILSAFFYQPIFTFLQQPVDQAFAQTNVEPQIITGLTDAFLSIVKAVFMASLVLASPFLFKEVWKFIQPGLKVKEIRVMRPLFFCGIFFFLAGAALAYTYVAPLGMTWLLSLNKSLEINSLIRINESIDFVVNLMLVFGLSFETPLVIMGLLRAEIVRLESLRQVRKYVLLAALILGAFLTPPDIPTQLVLATALVGLYEVGLILGRFGLPGNASKLEQDPNTQEEPPAT